MAKSFDQGKDEVANLCKYFATNRDSFLAPGVKEAHVRSSLIDPFFETLGWDVHNASRVAPQFREVIPEDSLDIEGQQRAPDYVFRVGTLPKFYAEAKKCGISIDRDPISAYQLRRYGWSAKLPLSILTDFEEFAVFDCTQRPRPSDKSSQARIKYVRFDEYPDRWREIWDIFSRDAVWSGAFDQFSASKRAKRGTSEVDTEFLKEIEGWRDKLAHNIANRNPDLAPDDFNRAVQLIIDRVVFLRMAEDRGLEPYEQLLRLTEQPDIYTRFVKELCRKADAKYNSGLFHFQREATVAEEPDRITPKLIIDDKVFKPILQSLYFEHGSPYEFSVLPVEILGTVYERFLGKVIRLTAGHHARVEEKPEVRKAGGVYYTPAYIVDYIVKNTAGKLIEGKRPEDLVGAASPKPAPIEPGKTSRAELAASSPKQQSSRRRGPVSEKPPLRILDMACGSGSFLLGAYQCLLDHYLHWYTTHNPEAYAARKQPPICSSQSKIQNLKSEMPDWRLTIQEKKRILTTHIFGVDIDAQAVEVSKLSLLLKVLEGESDLTVGQQMQLYHERALPNLSDNIKCGNSLIGPDYFTSTLIPDPEEMKRVNPFDWNREFPDAMNSGGFDCVIGNPPYVRIQTMKEWAPLEVEIYKELYQSARSGNYDIYVVFVEAGLKRLSTKGRLGFILPTKFFATDYGEGLRSVIAEGGFLSEVIDFAYGQVFENATTYTCLLFLSRQAPDLVSYARVPEPRSIAMNPVPIVRINRDSLTRRPWIFSSAIEDAIAKKLLSISVPLGQLPARMARGSSTGADDVFMLLTGKTGELTTRQGTEVDIEREILKTPIYATDFSRFQFMPSSGEVVIFPYVVSPKGHDMLAEQTMRRDFPRAYRYLEGRRKELEQRKQFRAWYGFSAPRNLDVHLTAQMLVPLLADRGLYCRLPQDVNKFCLMAGAGFSITVDPKAGMLPEYVLGLLNSTVLFWRLRTISNVFRGGWITCTKQYVETLPIRLIDFSDRRDKSRHDRMVQLVEQMLTLHKQLAGAKSERERGVLERQIAATDAEIDRLVYDLYGLTEDEIAIVEGLDNT